MTETPDSPFSTSFVGVALIVTGIGTILYGGSVSSGSFIEIFGFEFGRGERRPMSRGESWFWWLAAIGFGVWLLRSVPGGPLAGFSIS